MRLNERTSRVPAGQALFVAGVMILAMVWSQWAHCDLKSLQFIKNKIREGPSPRNLGFWYGKHSIGPCEIKDYHTVLAVGIFFFCPVGSFARPMLQVS